MGKRAVASVDSRGTTAIRGLRPGMRYGDKVSDGADRRMLVLGRPVQGEAVGDVKQDPLTD